MEEQLIASNIDTVFLVSALNNDFNIRRIERYVTLAWESGASPVIVLTKADLSDDIDAKVLEVEEVAIGVPIHVTSSITHQGIEDLNKYLQSGTTIALLGSSGVGKSTLSNILSEKEQQAVHAIRNDDKGRHTTTSRDLLVFDKGLILDTPGLRELQLWNTEEAVSNTFQDIKGLENACKFRDCQHESEPGCAIQKAIEDGIITEARYHSYLKLLRETAFIENSTAYMRDKIEKTKHYRHQATQHRKMKKHR
ncbi:ribosome small subunit-dependent GTPase A [Gracilibacillus salinarum]|uniref:Ribosome small subunit-dependent GTPase A n=1 Tax=Gracilibacillus salinarum TaxID=2932255 RepID=A0ABY4GTA4_9BACI|nr:ribosome small subunit-dependent GTPase A [Gracilibacillus salinarum]UOQ87378.1 ribosome small subunit-dependent GTPase A [Gracilibacillus salinarum]